MEKYKIRSKDVSENDKNQWGESFGQPVFEENDELGQKKYWKKSKKLVEGSFGRPVFPEKDEIRSNKGLKKDKIRSKEISKKVKKPVEESFLQKKTK